MDEHDHSEMSSDEYNRLYLEIHGRLTDEEHRFWAKTAALNIQSSVHRAERAERDALRWRRLAVLYAALSVVFVLLWSFS